MFGPSVTPEASFTTTAPSGLRRAAAQLKRYMASGHRPAKWSPSAQTARSFAGMAQTGPRKPAAPQAPDGHLGQHRWAVGEGGTIIKALGRHMVVATDVRRHKQPKRRLGPIVERVYAVGDTGVIRKFDGSNWTAMTSTTTMNLSSMVGDATSAVAVGQNGTIGRCRAARSAQTSGTTEQLSAVFFTSEWSVCFGRNKTEPSCVAVPAPGPRSRQEPASR